MAFSYTKDGQGILGNKRFAYGSYNCSAVTGGDIVTDLTLVENITLQPKGSSVATNQSVVNETLPLANSNGAVTIVTDSGQVGYWFALGL
jgi:hypothetical protein